MGKHANEVGEKDKNMSKVWRKEKKMGIKIILTEELMHLWL